MKKGFTLIELLVVITILAVLAGAALPYVQNYVEESRVAKAKADLEEIARALAVYETREGDYVKLDVSDLTGRYLNKSPIDPWGAPYVVEPSGGIVYSTGPDRKDDTTGKFDNINVPYQPPLALVSVKWVDKNQSGKVDFQNVSDELHLSFSRKLGVSNIDFTGVVNTNIDSATGLLSAIVDGAEAKIVGSKVVIYPIKTNNAFVAGRDSLTVQANQTSIYDIATPDKNYCLSSQDVKILPQ
ncbi:MAG TPA: prepilin-type N-terminal cleavage/methylation domain-containing protein [Candidatus Rifleibacterium sp.]|nr:prepilin-type N-terminal cleavage/methylation domain-containing protein [Candidatus Rifleibacterium sp.]